MRKDSSARLAVVILNWNGEKWLQQFLPSVVEHTPSEWADIVLVDNASVDNSVGWVKGHYPSILILQWEKNWGYAEGYNRAVEQLDYPYLCLLNSDVEIKDSRWVCRPLEILDQDHRVAAVQPKILSQKAPRFFEYAGAAGGYIDRWGYPFCRGRIFDRVEEDLGQYDQEVEIGWASGAALFIRRGAYLEAGGLDATFFAHMEEIDLAWRLWHLGYRSVFTHRSQVFHVGGGTLAQENPKKTYLNFRNNLLMLQKNLFPCQWYILYIRWFMDMFSLLLFGAQGKQEHARAVWDAHCNYRKKRKEVQPFARCSCQKRGASPCESVIIPIRYFLFRKSHYSSLGLRPKSYPATES